MRIDIIFTILNIIQEPGHLIGIQTNYFFFMKLWHFNQHSGIVFYQLMFIIISVERPQS